MNRLDRILRSSAHRGIENRLKRIWVLLKNKETCIYLYKMSLVNYRTIRVTSRALFGLIIIKAYQKT